MGTPAHIAVQPSQRVPFSSQGPASSPLSVPCSGQFSPDSDLLPPPIFHSPPSRTLQMPCLLPLAPGSTSLTCRPLVLWAFFCPDWALAGPFRSPRPLAPRPKPCSSLPAETFSPALWQPVPWPLKTALGQPGHAGPGPGPSLRSGAEDEQGRAEPLPSPLPAFSPAFSPPSPRRHVCVLKETASATAAGNPAAGEARKVSRKGLHLVSLTT